MNFVLQETGHVQNMPVEEFSERLVGYLRKDRGYSLETRLPAGDADSLLRWVDSTEAGHCELYAGAFVLISRYAGYPTRMVTGYAGGDWNGFESYYMVRNRNAHAWCEIYNPDRGWIRVDPTPGYGADPGSVDNALAMGGIRLDRTWKAYLDSLRVLWYRRVIQFDSEDQKVLATTALDVGSGALHWAIRKFRDWKDSLKGNWNQLAQEGKWGGFVSDILVYLLIASTFVVFGYWVRTRSRKRNFEQVMRRRAGMLLRTRGEILEKEDPMIHAVIQAVRYGDSKNWPDEVATFLKRAER